MSKRVLQYQRLPTRKRFRQIAKKKMHFPYLLHESRHLKSIPSTTIQCPRNRKRDITFTQFEALTHAVPAYIFHRQFQWAVSIGPHAWIMGYHNRNMHGSDFIQVVLHNQVYFYLAFANCTKIESPSIGAASLTVKSDVPTYGSHLNFPHNPVMFSVEATSYNLPFIFWVFRHFVALKQRMNYWQILQYLGVTTDKYGRTFGSYVRVKLYDAEIIVTHSKGHVHRLALLPLIHFKRCSINSIQI